MKGITLVRATIHDLDLFLDTEKSVRHLKTYSALTDEKEAREFFKTNTIYLIKKGGRVVGNISYELKGNRRAYISGLVVKPEFQGSGIGRAALKTVLGKLKKMRQIDLVTHPKNTPALLLYLSFGFFIHAWKDNYFGDGEPRLFLVHKNS
jgi:ribosomal protein S18 acetylase RimI-like enzyme